MDDPIFDDIALLEAAAEWDPLVAIDKHPDSIEAARLIRAVQLARKALGAAEEELARFLADVLPLGPTPHILEGVPPFTIKMGGKRSAWDHDAIRLPVASRIAEDMGTLVGPVVDVITAFCEITGPPGRYRTTALRQILEDADLKLDEVCVTSYGPPAVVFVS